ncbi:hypothetical protein H5410_040253, partial [Solanum commersonii]
MDFERDPCQGFLAIETSLVASFFVGSPQHKQILDSGESETCCFEWSPSFQNPPRQLVLKSTVLEVPIISLYVLVAIPNNATIHAIGSWTNATNEEAFLRSKLYFLRVPYCQTNMTARKTKASTRETHPPCGTLVNAEDRYTPSMNQKNRRKQVARTMFLCHTNIMTSVMRNMKLLWSHEAYKSSITSCDDGLAGNNARKGSNDKNRPIHTICMKAMSRSSEIGYNFINYPEKNLIQ